MFTVCKVISGLEGERALNVSFCTSSSQEHHLGGSLYPVSRSVGHRLGHIATLFPGGRWSLMGYVQFGPSVTVSLSLQCLGSLVPALHLDSYFRGFLNTTAYNNSSAQIWIHLGSCTDSLDRPASRPWSEQTVSGGVRDCLEQSRLPPVETSPVSHESL